MFTLKKTFRRQPIKRHFVNINNIKSGIQSSIAPVLEIDGEEIMLNKLNDTLIKMEKSISEKNIKNVEVSIEINIGVISIGISKKIE
jgi:hypothetical protein